MLETSARLLRLLTVLQTRRYWTGSALSDHLAVTPRTRRRDVDRLRSLGYAVDATSGPGGGYQLGKGTAIPPLHLADDEAVAVAVALQTAADVFVGLSDTAMRVFAKLDGLLPGRLRRRVTAIRTATISIMGAEATIDPDIVTILATACHDSERIELDYTDRSKQPTRRIIEPLRLARVGDRRWYLVAYDVERADWRTFRVDRVQSIRSIGPRFVPREPPEGVATYLAESISHAPYRYRARLLLHGSHERLSKRIPPWCGVLEPGDDRTSILRIGASSIEGLVCVMVVIGVDFEILEPKSLVPRVRKLSSRLVRATDRSENTKEKTK